ncbi:MAG: hypothetical protein R3263_01540 [Myxococcota bacterium]|nr:hypothetical protein [Myxococcota bacterium]
MALARFARNPLVHVITAATIGLGAAASAAEETSDAVRARDDRIADLERKLDLLASELDRVRTQVAVPEEPELKSAYGLGPAASKIYGVERGLSIGGYGEANYRNFIGDRNEGDLDRADFLRMVLYFGYKFTENIVFNSEIEFEHGSTSSTPSSGGGSVSVEFAALDFFWRDEANFRAGMLLLPMGFLNEVHEPPYYYGVTRPEVEQRIIPSTWRENGVGIFGRIGEDLEYRSYVTTGFNALGFSDSGIRGGRQKGNRALAEDLAWTTRLDWTPEVVPGLLLGGSFYVGDSGQDQELASGLDVPDARLWIVEGHAQYQTGPWHFRSLFAYSQLSDTTDLNIALGSPRDEPVAEAMFGGYGEVAYDVWPSLFGNAEKSLEPFVRVEYVDTQLEVPSGFEANDENSYWVFTPGLQFKPHPNVVLKLEYRNLRAAGGNRADELAIGMGFAF